MYSLLYHRLDPPLSPDQTPYTNREVLLLLSLGVQGQNNHKLYVSGHRIDLYLVG